MGKRGKDSKESNEPMPEHDTGKASKRKVAEASLKPKAKSGKKAKSKVDEPLERFHTATPEGIRDLFGKSASVTSVSSSPPVDLELEEKEEKEKSSEPESKKPKILDKDKEGVPESEKQKSSEPESKEPKILEKEAEGAPESEEQKSSEPESKEPKILENEVEEVPESENQKCEKQKSLEPESKEQSMLEEDAPESEKQSLELESKKQTVLEDEKNQPLGSAVKEAFKTVKEHELFPRFLKELRLTRKEVSEWESSDTHKDPLADLKEFNLYLGKHNYQPIDMSDVIAEHVANQKPPAPPVWVCDMDDSELLSAVKYARGHRLFLSYVQERAESRPRDLTWCFAKDDPFGDLSDFNKYLIDNGYDHDAVDLTKISFRPTSLQSEILVSDLQKALDGQELLVRQESIPGEVEGAEVLPGTVAEPEEQEKDGVLGEAGGAEKDDIPETVAEPAKTNTAAQPEQNENAGEIGNAVGVEQVLPDAVRVETAPVSESGPQGIATMDAAHLGLQANHEGDRRWSLSDLLQLEVEDEEEDYQSLLEATVFNLSLPDLNAIKSEILNHPKFSQVARQCEDEVNADCDPKEKWIWGKSEEDLGADVECWVEQFTKLFPKTSSAMPSSDKGLDCRSVSVGGGTLST